MPLEQIGPAGRQRRRTADQRRESSTDLDRPPTHPPTTTTDHHPPTRIHVCQHARRRLPLRPGIVLAAPPPRTSLLRELAAAIPRCRRPTFFPGRREASDTLGFLATPATSNRTLQADSLLACVSLLRARRCRPCCRAPCRTARSRAPSSASTSARPTRASRSWTARRRASSRTPRVAGRRPRSSPSPRTASA